MSKSPRRKSPGSRKATARTAAAASARPARGRSTSADAAFVPRKEETIFTQLPSNKVYLAKIRHELRTPINHIIGYSEMLEEEVADSVDQAFVADLKRIQSAGRQLLEVVNDLFDGSSAEGRKIDLRKSLHELRTPVNHVVGYSELLEERAVEFGQPQWVADLQKIRLAGRNLLGMVEQQLLQPEKVPTALVGGPDPALRFLTVGRNQPHYSGGGRILIVDDDESNRQMLARRLQKEKYTVTIAESGQRALELLKSAEFDLILLDMIMPGMDGYEMLEVLQGDEKLRHLPVIMLSAMDAMDSVVGCIEGGAEDYISKPFNPVFLKARIGAAMEKKRLRDQERIYLKRIQEEQEKSERLLLNVLPAPIAERLKNGETSIVDSFPDVTVVFADVVGFTSLSIHISPTEVVRLLNEVFSAFDLLATRYGLEKIKTIGDAYMAVSGLPMPRKDHVEAAAEFALDMQSEIEQFNRGYRTHMRIRVGINTGPVIAGIIGRNKFIYDLWGDTVNTASRMESHGLPGRIQVTDATYEVLKKNYFLERRGVMDIKGKGTMETFFLTGRIHKRPQVSVPRPA